MIMSCIYSITNLVNNKIYIGYTLNYRSRKSHHLHGLKNNNHPNKYLQKSWNKYGEENFTFEIIEYCEKENLALRENYWCNLLNSHDPNFGYNLAPCLQETAKLNNPKIKIINQFTKNKVFVATYNGFLEAQRKTNINSSSIREACLNKRLTAGGFIWRFENDPIDNYKKRINNAAKIVIQMTLEDEIVNIYKSTVEAAEKLKVFHQCISKACRENKIYKKFKWKYGN